MNGSASASLGNLASASLGNLASASLGNLASASLGNLASASLGNRWSLSEAEVEAPIHESGTLKTVLQTLVFQVEKKINRQILHERFLSEKVERFSNYRSVLSPSSL